MTEPISIRACRFALACIQGKERDYTNQLLALLQLAVSTADDETHQSDCALHNEPAYPIQPCNCGIYKDK